LNIEQQLSQAKVLYEKRDYENALVPCGEHLDQHPNDAEALRLVSKILESLNRVDEAIDAITRLLGVSDFKEPCDYFARGRWLLKVGKLNDAINDFESIISVSNEINDRYYTDVARIFLTYSLALTVRKSEAKEQLALLGDDFLIYVNKNRVDRQYLEQMLH